MVDSADEVLRLKVGRSGRSGPDGRLNHKRDSSGSC
jgi:hypothetical protein